MVSNNLSTAPDALSALELNLTDMHLEVNRSRTSADCDSHSSLVHSSSSVPSLSLYNVDERVSLRVLSCQCSIETLVNDDGPSTTATISHADTADFVAYSNAIRREILDFSRDELPPPSAPKLRPLAELDDLQVPDYSSSIWVTDAEYSSDGNSDCSSRDSSPPATPRSLLLVFDDVPADKESVSTSLNTDVFDLHSSLQGWVCCGVPQGMPNSAIVPDVADVHVFEGTPMVGGCWKSFMHWTSYEEHLMTTSCRGESDSGLVPLLSSIIPTSDL